MMEVGFDPNHPGYADAQEWVEWAFGDQLFDPAAFDVDAMDKLLMTMFEPAS
jgi:hypothetical protein